MAFYVHSLGIMRLRKPGVAHHTVVFQVLRSWAINLLISPFKDFLCLLYYTQDGCSCYFNREWGGWGGMRHLHLGGTGRIQIFNFDQHPSVS